MKQFKPHQKQVPDLLNKHMIIHVKRTSFDQQILYIINRILLMSQLNLPTLSLFNKTVHRAKKQHCSCITREQSPFVEAIRQTNRINEQVYTSHLPCHPLYHDYPPYPDYYQKDMMELQYMKAYQDTLRRQQALATITPRLIEPRQILPIRYDPLPYDFTLQKQFAQAESSRKLQKTPYINHQYVSNKPIKIEDKERSTLVPMKEVYLNSDRQKKQETEYSAIQRIDNRSIVEEKNNISKIINDSNIQKSILIESKEKKEVISELVQTEDLQNRSSFFIETRKPKKMDLAGFQRTIRDLNTQINSINLDLSSEDIIIDLSDLVTTKEQYMEQSKTILRDLQFLSDQKSSRNIMIRSKKQGEMIWPQL